MNIFKKVIYFIKRPPIVVFDNNLFLEKFFLNFSKKEYLIKIGGNLEIIKFLIRYSKRPIIILNEKNTESEEIISLKKGIFLLNSKFFRKREAEGNFFTYGIKDNADFRISDINIDSQGVNFKLNHKGSTVPFWVKGEFDEKEVEKMAGFISLFYLSGKNFVEISQKIRNLF